MLAVLSSFDEGPDLALYYKYLLTLRGEREYERHFNPSDALTPSQREHAAHQLAQFDSWYAAWPR